MENQNEKTLAAYYDLRANEYDKIYSKPERQQYLEELSAMLQQIFNGKNVLEIACGTGYWTEKIAQTAKYIMAIDINNSVLQIAKQRRYPSQNVEFQIADFYNLNLKNQESLFGGFIWSHIPLQKINAFLDVITEAVSPGGTIVFTDNIYVEGSSLPVTETDEHGNTYQVRRLEDGTTCKIIKNFPSEDFLLQTLKLRSSEGKIFKTKYYWTLVYKTPSN